MTKQQEAAIARVCAHECMQRDLIEALECLVEWYGNRDWHKDELLPAHQQGRQIAASMEVLARAKEQQ